MKVNDPALNQPGAAQPERAREAERTSVAGKDAAARAGVPGDQVQLSDLSSRLMEVLQTETSARAARLERLAAEVRSGRYQPDPQEISRRLIDEALQLEP